MLTLVATLVLTAQPGVHLDDTAGRSTTLLAWADAPQNATLEQQVQGLELEIEGIGRKLQNLPRYWPAGAITMVVIGSLIALPGLVLLLVPVVGIPVLLVGAGLIAGGVLVGTSSTRETQLKRQELLARRDDLQRQLSQLKQVKQQAAMGEDETPVLLTLATF
jgi:hypothetical protein